MRITTLAIFVLLTTSVVRGQDDRQRPDRDQQSFRSAFSVSGVELSDDQKKKIEEIRNEFAPQLKDLQRRRIAVLTAQQRRAMQEATRQARQAGKSSQQARQAGEAAAKMSDQQKEQTEALAKEQRKIAEAIQVKVRALLTDQQRTRSRRNPNASRRIRPNHANLSYGPHPRNVMDVWLADSAEPTPVLVSIHGGGFRGGNKSVEPGLLKACLESGISVAAITYRLSDVAIAPAQFTDSARAIQFIRHNAKAWNLDSTRIASTGGSAGAGLSLWLGFHDDLADPNSDDPVLRHSTRLSCMAVYNGQTSYDPRRIRELFPENDTYKHPALAQLFDVDLDRLDQLPEEKYRLFAEVSAIEHLSKDDVPALLIYASEMETKVTNQSIGIHHPRFAKVLKEEMDDLGLECAIETGARRGDEDFTRLVMSFVKKHFKMK